MKDHIISIEAMEILDSRGNPTIRTRVSLETEFTELPQFLPEHQPEKMRPLNSVMVTRAVTVERCSEGRGKREPGNCTGTVGNNP
ncbi:MAG: hypothetical protein Ct9H300mP28_01380 [Pseudomonadota bacterium]|nr:MAG: hypothetical protein Ct9H300mP28_01380 [Pseudomonadota bacterium]